MPRAAFRFRPGITAAGAIRRIQLLGNNPFQRHAAGRLQHRVTAAREMLHVADEGLVNRRAQRTSFAKQTVVHFWPVVAEPVMTDLEETIREKLPPGFQRSPE